MSRDPYEPESKVSERTAPRYRFLWKGYFVFSVYVAIVTSVYVPTIKQLSYFDILDFGVSLLAVVGLYGYVYSARLGRVVFWRYFFYVALVEAILFCLLVPLFGGQRYGREFHLDGYYLVELAYVGLMLYALNLYAYKRPAIWRKKPV